MSKQSTTQVAKAASPTVAPRAGRVLQRACACGQHAGGECASCRKQRTSTLQRAAVTSLPAGNAPPIVHAALRGPGQPLEAATRAALEPRFGHDFSRVRVHTGPLAAQSAQDVSALAYTVGEHIAFGAGQYTPRSASGQRLLAHELTHVVQQQGHSPGAGGNLSISAPTDSSEQAADAAAERVATGGQIDLSTVHAQAPTLARAPAPACPKTFAKAGSFKALIDLVRAAEAKLKAAGITSTDDQIKTLRGIYYGTTWSSDFKEQKSTIRNAGFQTFTQSLAAPQVPSTILDCGLFAALQASQDVVEGKGTSARHVDFGHLIIALDARNALLPGFTMPGFGGTGTEIVTWLGDLGGGAASLAVDRVVNPMQKVEKKFQGSNFGGSINLEGDVAGFVVGRNGATSLVAPVIPSGKGIADILEDYLSPGKPGSEWKARATTFLTMHGGTFDTSGALTNGPALITKFAAQIETFACQYLLVRVKDGRVVPSTAKVAADHIPPCSQEVAKTFVDALEDCHKTGAKLEAKRFPTAMKAAPGACSAIMATVPTAKKAGAALKDAKKQADEGMKEVEGGWKKLLPW